MEHVPFSLLSIYGLTPDLCSFGDRRLAKTKTKAKITNKNKS